MIVILHWRPLAVLVSTSQDYPKEGPAFAGPCRRTSSERHSVAFKHYIFSGSEVLGYSSAHPTYFRTLVPFDSQTPGFPAYNFWKLAKLPLADLL